MGQAINNPTHPNTNKNNMLETAWGGWEGWVGVGGGGGGAVSSMLFCLCWGWQGESGKGRSYNAITYHAKPQQTLSYTSLQSMLYHIVVHHTEPDA